MLALELLCNSLCGPLPKTLKSPCLYKLNGQSQTHRRGCHCWELQDEPFAFCGRIGTACVDLRNRVFSSLLIDFLLRATKKERKSALKRLRYYVSPRQCFLGRRSRQCFLQLSTNTLQQVETFKYLGAGWYSRVTKVSTKGLIHGLVKQTQFCVSFIAPWWRNRGFQTTQTFQFLNLSLFRSSPVVMNLRWKINGRDGMFAKSSRCDTLWQRAQV